MPTPLTVNRRLYTKESSNLPRDIQLLGWRKSTHPDGSVITWSIQESEDEFVHYRKPAC